MEKVFRIYAKEVKIEKDGVARKFLSYSMKSGKAYYNVKFRKECTNVPTSKGYYLVRANNEDCNIKQATGEEKYSTLWVKNVISITHDVDYEAKVKKESQDKTDSVLDGSTEIFD